MHRPLRLTVDRTAIQANWRWLQDRAGRAGGGRDQGRRLRSWRSRDGRRPCIGSVAAISSCRPGPRPRRSALLPLGTSLVVLHGVGPKDAEAAAWRIPAGPASIRRAGRPLEGDRARATVRRHDRHRHEPARPRPTDIGLLDGLSIDTLHSHLACADEDSAMNAMQLERFRAIVGSRSRRVVISIANSAGICLGRDYSFDLVRPGIALYGGIPRAGSRGQHPAGRRGSRRRSCSAGRSPPARAAAMARPSSPQEDTEAAILNIGYADGYLRGFSSRGSAFAGEYALPVLGRVSMDLIAVGCDSAPAAQGRRLGRDRLRLAVGVEAVRAFAVRAFDDPRFALRAALALVALLRRRGLRLVAAQVDHRTAPAFGQPRLAGVAAVQDQPVVRVAAERAGARSSRASPPPHRRSLPGARPVRLQTRKTCVSTANVSSPKAVLSTTFAVLRPTPGSACELFAGRAELHRRGWRSAPR